MDDFISNGVMMCDDCGLATHQIKPASCKNDKHPPVMITALLGKPMGNPNGVSYDIKSYVADGVEHTWHNIYVGDRVYYDCKCGEHFDTHKELMKHTAELNPKLDTLTMGTAGAAIERESHTKTLDLLRRARDILLMTDDVADESVNTLLEDIDKQCPVLAEEDE